MNGASLRKLKQIEGLLDKLPSMVVPFNRPTLRQAQGQRYWQALFDRLRANGRGTRFASEILRLPRRRQSPGNTSHFFPFIHLPGKKLELVLAH